MRQLAAIGLDEIAGLKEHIERQRVRQAQCRELNFLGRTHDICGIRVRAMTVLDFCVLTHAQSPLLCRINPSIDDLLVFMVQLAADRGWRWQQRLGKRCRKLNAEQWALRCFEYFDEMLSDMPSGASGTSHEAALSFVANWCYAMESECGWTEQQVLDCPLPKLFQYLRASKQRNNPRAPEGNRMIDDPVNRILRDLNEGKYTLEDLKSGRAKFDFN